MPTRSPPAGAYAKEPVGLSGGQRRVGSSMISTVGMGERLDVTHDLALADRKGQPRGYRHRSRHFQRRSGPLACLAPHRGEAETTGGQFAAKQVGGDVEPGRGSEVQLEDRRDSGRLGVARAREPHPARRLRRHRALVGLRQHAISVDFPAPFSPSSRAWIPAKVEIDTTRNLRTAARNATPVMVRSGAVVRSPPAQSSVRPRVGAMAAVRTRNTCARRKRYRHRPSSAQNRTISVSCGSIGIRNRRCDQRDIRSTTRPRPLNASPMVAEVRQRCPARRPVMSLACTGSRAATRRRPTDSSRGQRRGERRRSRR